MAEKALAQQAGYALAQQAGYALPNNEFGYRTTHTCELCGYEPKTKNKYREKQDHLVMKHFKERVERDFAATHTPYRYVCPQDGCGFEAKDKQGLLRHYTGKHRVIEAYLGQALAARGFVVAPPGGTKRRRSSGLEETTGTSGHEGTASGYESTASGHEDTASGHEGTASGHEGTASGHESTASGQEGTASGQEGTLNPDKEESPGYQDNPGYPRHISSLPGSKIAYIGHAGTTPVYPGGQGYGATGVDHNTREGYGATRVDHNIREAVLKENGRAGSGHPKTIVNRVEEGGRYRMVQGAGYVLPEGVSYGERLPRQGEYGGLRKPMPALPDPHMIKREVEALMSSFGLKAFVEPPAEASTQPYTTTQSYATHGRPSPEYASPPQHQHTSPSSQEYVSTDPKGHGNPSPQEYANPSPQEYISPSQEYVSHSQEYIDPSQKYASSSPISSAPSEYANQTPQEYASPSPQDYAGPSQGYASPSPQDYASPSQDYASPSPQDYVSPSQDYASDPQQHVHSPDEYAVPKHRVIPTPVEFTYRPQTSPYPSSTMSTSTPSTMSTSTPSSHPTTSPYTPPHSEPPTPETSSSDPLEPSTVTPKLEPE